MASHVPPKPVFWKKYGGVRAAKTAKTSGIVEQIEPRQLDQSSLMANPWDGLDIENDIELDLVEETNFTEADPWGDLDIDTVLDEPAPQTLAVKRYGCDINEKTIAQKKSKISDEWYLTCLFFNTKI